jgi:hypothetical protein
MNYWQYKRLKKQYAGSPVLQMLEASGKSYTSFDYASVKHACETAGEVVEGDTIEFDDHYFYFKGLGTFDPKGNMSGIEAARICVMCMAAMDRGKFNYEEYAEKYGLTKHFKAEENDTPKS